MSENDIAWQAAIHDLNLDQLVQISGFARISADQLNRYRQARLMVKFDHESQLPGSLKTRGWTIFSVSNSEYLIGPFKLFQQLPSPAPGLEAEYRRPRLDLDTLAPDDIASESDALLLAHASGILDEFIGESTTLTTFGRRRSEAFEFTIENSQTTSTNVSVSGTQIEIDAGFEGENTFTVVECKNFTCTDFNLRQLYFPYRYWSERISKSVVPVFMTFSNGVFDLYKFDFLYPDDINSGELVSHSRFTTVESPLTLQALFGFAKYTIKSDVSNVPFPQADNFEKVIKVVEICGSQGLRKSEIAEELRFDLRQAGYYANAAKFLGLATDANGIIRASMKGEAIFRAEETVKQSKLAACLLSVTPVAETFLQGNRYLRAQFDLEFAKTTLQGSDSGNSLSEATLTRRAKTIVNWCRWLDSIVKN